MTFDVRTAQARMRQRLTSRSSVQAGCAVGGWRGRGPDADAPRSPRSGFLPRVGDPARRPEPTARGGVVLTTGSARPWAGSPLAARAASPPISVPPGAVGIDAPRCPSRDPPRHDRPHGTPSHRRSRHLLARPDTTDQTADLGTKHWEKATSTRRTVHRASERQAHRSPERWNGPLNPAWVSATSHSRSPARPQPPGCRACRRTSRWSAAPPRPRRRTARSGHRGPSPSAP